MAVFRFEHEGRTALGFGSGLSSAEFARQRAGELLSDSNSTETGYILTGDPFQASLWRPLGVIERNGEMVIWGENVDGEPLLDIICEKTEKDAPAEQVLSLFLRAAAFKNANETGFSPAGVFVDTEKNTVFLPPPQLVKAALQPSWLKDGERWVHPDLKGKEAATFTAAALLYARLSGFPPFNVGGDEAQALYILHADIRESVFLPLHLAAPSTAPLLASQVDAVLSGKPGITLDFSKMQVPDAEQQAADGVEREKQAFLSRQRSQVKRRRFLRRNRTALIAAAAALAVVGIVGMSFVNTLSKRPTTEGLSPVEVVEAYYSAFSSLDQDMMSACVTGQAGKNDLNAAAYIFVTDRTREAYEGRSFLYPASEYAAGGNPPLGARVFGITGLDLSPPQAGSSEEVTVHARYTLYTPFSSQEPDAAVQEETPPQGEAWEDTLSLVKKKGRWRIAKITRQSGGA